MSEAIDKLVEYVKFTPHNTNPEVVRSLAETIEEQAGGEPEAYIKDASVSEDGSTLTLTKKDDSTVSFQGGSGLPDMTDTNFGDVLTIEPTLGKKLENSGDIVNKLYINIDELFNLSVQEDVEIAAFNITQFDDSEDFNTNIGVYINDADIGVHAVRGFFTQYDESEPFEFIYVNTLNQNFESGEVTQSGDAIIIPAHTAMSLVSKWNEEIGSYCEIVDTISQGLGTIYELEIPECVDSEVYTDVPEEYSNIFYKCISVNENFNKTTGWNPVKSILDSIPADNANIGDALILSQDFIPAPGNRLQEGELITKLYFNIDELLKLPASSTQKVITPFGIVQFDGDYSLDCELRLNAYGATGTTGIHHFLGICDNHGELEIYVNTTNDDYQPVGLNWVVPAHSVIHIYNNSVIKTLTSGIYEVEIPECCQTTVYEVSEEYLQLFYQGISVNKAPWQEIKSVKWGSPLPKEGNEQNTLTLVKETVDISEHEEIVCPGYIKTVRFNKKMTVDEVDTILSNLSFVDASALGYGLVYGICATSSMDKGVVVFKRQTPPGSNYFAIGLLMNGAQSCIYDSYMGWYQIGDINFNDYSVDSVAGGLPIGQQNEELLDLCYVCDIKEKYVPKWIPSSNIVIIKDIYNPNQYVYKTGNYEEALQSFYAGKLNISLLLPTEVGYTLYYSNNQEVILDVLNGPFIKTTINNQQVFLYEDGSIQINGGE